MSDNNFKKTYNGFIKLVLWGTVAVIAILVILAITLL
ncbi:aa3-type cytochrome c oxidase subunit IV [Pelagibacterales bacterium SAG-MED41]|nr:aa3-type cytochrome c oxidase subunit IV [Pelagibacterales bacterium SAG-MED41]